MSSHPGGCSSSVAEEPRSPGEAVGRAERFAARAEEITAEQAAAEQAAAAETPAEGDSAPTDLQLSDELAVFYALICLVCFALIARWLWTSRGKGNASCLPVGCQPAIRG